MCACNSDHRASKEPKIAVNKSFDGNYSSGPDLSGETLTLTNGEFTLATWGDLGPSFKRGTGTYVIEANRITLSGTWASAKTSFTSVWYAYTVDGILVLAPFVGGRVSPELVCRSDVHANGNGWPDLFRKHPKLAWFDDWLDHGYRTPAECNGWLEKYN